MNYNLVIQVEAVLAIQVAFEWYENKIAGLGFELIEEIEDCYQKISVNPEYYTFINKQYRRIKTNRFPYLIIYEVAGNDVFVYNVMHAKQKKRPR